MNNYESIKNMSLEQMAVMLYLLIEPFEEQLAELLNENVDKAKTAREIKEFLLKEVKS